MEFFSIFKQLAKNVKFISMELKFNGSEGFSENQLNEFEELLNRELPSNLIEFLLQHGGSTPLINNKNCCFTINLFNGSIICGYIKKIVSYESLKNDLQYIGYLEEHVEYFSLSKDYVETQYLFPFAILAKAVVYVSIRGKHLNKVYYADNGDFGIIFLADSIELFFESLFECD
ncbi:MAG: SMI1/KNR4 family protein [Rickettsiales bacterium]|nr:MAG: SMI1/KNR4 family protein [Rickettsiales bacterium]